MILRFLVQRIKKWNCNKLLGRLQESNFEEENLDLVINMLGLRYLLDSLVTW